MDSKALASLISAIECGSIAKASRQQGITAAAVSQRIQGLEEILDTTLLNRMGHTAKPTDAAMAILPRARRIVRDVQLLRSDIQTNTLSGSIKMGSISTVLTGILPRALLSLHHEAPDIRPQITPGTSSALYDALVQEIIDVAIIVQPPFDIPKCYRWQQLYAEELILLSDMPESNVPDLLLTRPYIRYASSSWGGRLAQQYLDDNALQPNQLLELEGIEAITLLVREKMGVSLLPRWPGLSAIATGLTQLPVGRGYERNIILMARPESVSDKLFRLLFSVLSSQYQG